VTLAATERRDTPLGDPIRLWPGVAPGSEGWTYEEEAGDDPATGLYQFRNVVVPTITPVLPKPGTANGSAVVVAPGGGFASLIWHHEGTSTGGWFADRGVTAFVLKYRLAQLSADMSEVTSVHGPMPDLSDGDAVRAWFRKAIANVPDLATADAEQAVRVVRSRAAEWGVDPARVGIIGFSAGGTVATQAATTTDPEARPAFVANLYGSFLERDVPAGAPPYFAAVAADDHLCVGYVMEATQKWLAAGAPAELHIYESGGHAFGMTPGSGAVVGWTDRFLDWLAEHGVLPAAGVGEQAR
jgi:acetyl esterase/lipase